MNSVSSYDDSACSPRCCVISFQAASKSGPLRLLCCLAVAVGSAVHWSSRTPRRRNPTRHLARMKASRSSSSASTRSSKGGKDLTRFPSSAWITTRSLECRWERHGSRFAAPIDTCRRPTIPTLQERRYGCVEPSLVVMKLNVKHCLCELNVMSATVGWIRVVLSFYPIRRHECSDSHVLTDASLLPSRICYDPCRPLLSSRPPSSSL